MGIEDGRFIDGYSERYTLFTEGVEVIPKLAANLNGEAQRGEFREGIGREPRTRE